MIRIIPILCLALFVGCGATATGAYHYIDEFDRDFPGARTGPIKIAYESLPRPMVGQCIGGNIRLDAEAWADYSPARRKALIYHELGHCVLNLRHTGALDGECPDSLMFYQLVPEPCWERHRDDYIRRMRARWMNSNN